MTYLSFAPEGLREAFFTGGAAADRAGASTTSTARRTRARSSAAGATTSATRRTATACARCASASTREDVRLPRGDRLTARRLRQLGDGLGMSDGAERAALPARAPADSPAFRHDVEAALGFARNPLYAVAARGVLGRRRRDALGGASACCPPSTRTSPSCSPASTSTRGCSRTTARSRRCARRPSMLAEHEWPRLYDAERLARQRGAGRGGDLRRGHVRRARASPRRPPRASAACAPWLTNEYEHNGLRADGDRVLGRLIDLARGRA